MELSSYRLKYLLDVLKYIVRNIDFNNINSVGIQYFMNYIEENDEIEKLIIIYFSNFFHK